LLKEKTAQDLRERTVESFLDLLILTVLTKNPSMSAVDLMNFITQKFKVSLSLGILYSHLFHLEQDGLICGLKRHTRVYGITRKGKRRIDLAKKHRNAAQWVIDQILDGDAILPSP